MRPLAKLALCFLAALLGVGAAAYAGAEDAKRGGPVAKRPLNVIFLICDQESYHIRAQGDYVLPARKALQKRGVTFRNHYIASAVCTPSRALFFTGQTPQVNGVYDHLAYGYVPSLDPKIPNMGSVLKGLGYSTAYFGKCELNKKVLAAKRTDNTSSWLQPYGFDEYNADGDNHGGVRDGFNVDTFIGGAGTRWLRTNAPDLRERGQPFFMVMSFVNPHDIMFADCNPKGQPAVQKAIIPKGLLAPPPVSAIYDRRWEFKLPPSLKESLTAPGMPAGVLEYDKGWAKVFGTIPTDRKDMWYTYYNYYLNCLRDNDRSLQQVVDTLDDLDLWKDTVVVLTADHGEMGGTHGGLRGKGPLCYENNAHVPMVIVHPDAKGGKSCAALTSHLDLLPTFVGLAKIPDDRRPDAVKKLPGRDFSRLLADPEKAALDTVRPGILFNYVQPSTIDAEFNVKLFIAAAQGKRSPELTEVNLNKRGFLAFTFDGRYKLGRFYAPNAFHTPKTLDQLFKHNDVQVFDLQNDPEEMQNLALNRDKHKETILRLNGLLNDLMAREVGVNDGRFLAESIRPKVGPLD